MDKNLAEGQNLDSRFAQNEPVSSQPVTFHSPDNSFLGKYWAFLVAIPLILLLVLILNYFNILALSLLSPKVLGFLPHKPFNQSFGSYLQTNTNTQPTVLPFVCPVKKELCGAGQLVNITQAIPPFVGLAYENLASGSAVIAMTSGKYNSGVSVSNNGNEQSSSLSKTTVLTILDDIRNIEVDYQFKGTAYTPTGTGRGRVKPGDIIGWVSDKKLEQGLLAKQYNLIVSVQDLQSKEFTQLNTAELLKGTR